ncbi:hypothetical protein [Furfurilactobacillus milii]|uniref:Uncharacterized protein n=1 Tax=Furfurilactobacillus milii TaxID=2888272 RepID=A0A6N9I6U9_9LACO|nr:hypothetical protein [Furfurilactobacillus milii]MYV18186.1 hypothetical protein [Furfurilactobacillus milii]
MSFSTLGQQILISLLTVFFYGLALPLLFSWVLTLINRNTKQRLATYYGMNSQVYLGFLGIIVHESSHLIMALLFGHKITGLRLIKFAHPDRQATDPEALTLGYVNHRWNSGNSYQTMGNFFIGFAPIIGVSAVIFGITAWLWPTMFHNWVMFAMHPTLSNLFQPATSDGNLLVNTVRWIIWAILVTNLSVGGFDLSSADLRNSGAGVSSYIVLLGLIGLSAGVLTSSFTEWSRAHLVPVFFALSLVVVLSAVVNVVTRWLTKDK